MLILSRRVGESIIIGDTIKVTVLESGKAQFRIGIDAPRAIPVHREEIYQRIVNEKQKILNTQKRSEICVKKQ